VLSIDICSIARGFGTATYSSWGRGGSEEVTSLPPRGNTTRNAVGTNSRHKSNISIPSPFYSWQSHTLVRHGGQFGLNRTFNRSRHRNTGVYNCVPNTLLDSRRHLITGHSRIRTPCLLHACFVSTLLAIGALPGQRHVHSPVDDNLFMVILLNWY
jgi:hypothetical protein